MKTVAKDQFQIKLAGTIFHTALVHRFAGMAGRALPMTALLFLATSLAACNPEQPAGQAPVTPSVKVGGDRDEHGCIASAGYVWCAKESACARPWELAKEKGFNLDNRGFEDYCSGLMN